MASETLDITRTCDQETCGKLDAVVIENPLINIFVTAVELEILVILKILYEKIFMSVCACWSTRILTVNQKT
jgi:hypothetical protein